MIGAVAMDEPDRLGWQAGVRAMTLDPQGTHLAEAWRQVGTIDADPAFAPDAVLRHREVVDKLRAGTRWHEAYLAVFGTDMMSVLGRVTAPSLLLCGSSDILHPYVPATRRALPQAHYVPLAGGGYVLDQNPRAVLDPYIAFLSTI